MVLGVRLPSSSVCGAHLFRHRNSDLAEEFVGLDDINNPRNGLLLFKPIEEAFDNYQLCILCDGEQFIVHIVDPSIRSAVILENATPQHQIEVAERMLTYEELRDLRSRGDHTNAPGIDFELATTFGDLEGIYWSAL